jgi:hypothetical protein
MRGEAAQHEAAAMEEDHEWKRPAADGRIDPQFDRATWPVDAALLDFRHLGRRRHDGDPRFVEPPCLGDRQRMRRRYASPAIEQGLDLGIDRHSFVLLILRRRVAGVYPERPSVIDGDEPMCFTRRD